MHQIVYHATSKNSIDSFLSNGASAEFSHGKGQGKGLYVWTRKNLANDHVHFRRKKDKDFEGYVVEIDTRTTTLDDWLPDFEPCANLGLGLIRDEIEKFNSILTENSDISRIFPAPDYHGSTTFYIREFGGEYPIVMHSLPVFPWQLCNTENARILGPLIDQFRSKYPMITRETMKKWVETENIPALRYMGNVPLNVVSIAPCETILAA